jgi:hypothetical protein
MKTLKNLTALLIGCLFVTTAFASELIVMSSHYPVAISVDNGPYTAAGNKVSVKYIPEGYRLVSIYRMHSNGYGAAKPQLVFNSTVYIARAVDVIGTVNHNGRLKIVNTIAHEPQQVPVVPNITPVCNPTWACGTPAYNAVMNDADYNSLYHMLMQQSFDNTKLAIAKQALQGRNLNTQQVAGIMRTFTFESNKLDFAKYAYAYTVDQHRYFNVNPEFTFSSSIEDLIQFINRV